MGARLSWVFLYSKTRRRDRFTSATGAPTRTRQTGAFVKDKAAVSAGGGFEQELSALISTDGFHNMREMLFHVALGDADHLCQLKRRESASYQQLQNALSVSASGVGGHAEW